MLRGGERGRTPGLRVAKHSTATGSLQRKSVIPPGSIDGPPSAPPREGQRLTVALRSTYHPPDDERATPLCGRQARLRAFRGR